MANFRDNDLAYSDFQVVFVMLLGLNEDFARRGHLDELSTEPFQLLHREHGTGCRRN